MTARLKREKFSPSLIVLPGAEEIKFDKFRGEDELIYFVEDTFPAKRTVTGLHQRMTALGWTQLQEDFLNPGRRLSNNPELPPDIPSDRVMVLSWKAAVGFKTPDTFIYRWETQYKNVKGEIQFILLRYFDKYDAAYHVDSFVASIKPPRTNRLKINQIFYPAPLAKKMEKFAVRNSKEKIPQGDFDIY